MQAALIASALPRSADRLRPSDATTPECADSSFAAALSRADAPQTQKSLKSPKSVPRHAAAETASARHSTPKAPGAKIEDEASRETATALATTDGAAKRAADEATETAREAAGTADTALAQWIAALAPVVAQTTVDALQGPPRDGEPGAAVTNLVAPAQGADSPQPRLPLGPTLPGDAQPHDTTRGRTVPAASAASAALEARAVMPTQTPTDADSVAPPRRRSGISEKSEAERGAAPEGAQTGLLPADARTQDGVAPMPLGAAPPATIAAATAVAVPAMPSTLPTPSMPWTPPPAATTNAAAGVPHTGGSDSIAPAMGRGVRAEATQDGLLVGPTGADRMAPAPAALLAAARVATPTAVAIEGAEAPAPKPSTEVLPTAGRRDELSASGGSPQGTSAPKAAPSFASLLAEERESPASPAATAPRGTVSEIGTTPERRPPGAEAKPSLAVDPSSLAAAPSPASTASPSMRSVEAALPSLALPAPVGSPEFAPALAVSLGRLAREGIQEARLQLQPVEMGPIDVRISIEGAHARVDFAADVAATRAAIESSLPELASALREAGLTLSGGGVWQQPQGRAGAQAQHASRHNGRGASDDSAVAVSLPPMRRVAGVVDLYA